MHEATLSRAGDADIYIGAAAISDYRPAGVEKHKIK
jgi:phosphopantothenoylcysteine decarboxylase/phosphopantothenate--cysteine ligase